MCKAHSRAAEASHLRHHPLLLHAHKKIPSLSYKDEMYSRVTTLIRFALTNKTSAGTPYSFIPCRYNGRTLSQPYQISFRLGALLRSHVQHTFFSSLAALTFLHLKCQWDVLCKNTIYLLSSSSLFTFL